MQIMDRAMWKSCRFLIASLKSRYAAITQMQVSRFYLFINRRSVYYMHVYLVSYKTTNHIMALLVTCRRKALSSYTFHDGSTLSKGDWVCIPQQAMLQDGTRYKDAHIFDGFRFARANAQLQQLQPCAEVPDQKASRLTHVSPDWPIWGLGNMSW